MVFSEFDKKMMRRAVYISQFGLGYTYPNPVVGCVIAAQNQIIGEGWHAKAGQPHAEVLAINSIPPSSKHLLSNATAYVTLEPCAHHGRTPPCANLLIDVGIRKVVVALTDPFDKVNGKGIKIMQHGGIQVKLGLLSNEAAYVNRRFLYYAKHNRPYVVLKWAQTADGFMAPNHNNQYWISGPDARTIVHKWRTEENAIMVGANTAVADNPALDARLWPGPQPIKIVANVNETLPQHLKIFKKQPQTILLTNNIKAETQHQCIIIDSNSQNKWQKWLTQLAQLGIVSVLVEGGHSTLKNLIDNNLWNEARVFTSKEKKFGKGLKAPMISGETTGFFNLQADFLQIFERNA